MPSEGLWDLTVPLAAPADLIVTKRIAGRPMELEDMRWLLRSNPDIDRRRVRETVVDFASVLDSPELVEQLDAIVREVQG